MYFLEWAGLDVSEEGYVVGLMEWSGWDDNVTEGWGISVKIDERFSSLGWAIKVKQYYISRKENILMEYYISRN